MKKLQKLYPLCFHPVYKSYLWGGNTLATYYHRILPQGPVAESWEVADRPEGMSVISNGPLAGMNLPQLIEVYGERVAGRSIREFPLLLKIIDAKEQLSVQVHPDEKTAVAVGGEPKTEMWYILKAEPNSFIYASLQDDVDEQKFSDALRKGTVAECLKKFFLSKGDVVYIPGGRVHAIGAGLLILEVQQNSNTTYRLFDWNRIDRDGMPRALQIEKGLKSINWEEKKLPITIDRSSYVEVRNDNGNRIIKILETKYFVFETISVGTEISSKIPNNTCHILFCEEGEVSLLTESEVKIISLHCGQTVLIPPELVLYKMVAQSASVQLCRISLP